MSKAMYALCCAVVIISVSALTYMGGKYFRKSLMTHGTFVSDLTPALPNDHVFYRVALDEKGWDKCEHSFITDLDLKETTEMVQCFKAVPFPCGDHKAK